MLKDLSDVSWRATQEVLMSSMDLLACSQQHECQNI